MLLAGLCPQLLELCPVCSIGMYGCVGVSCTSEIEAQGWDVPEVTWWVGREATVQSTGSCLLGACLAEAICPAGDGDPRRVVRSGAGGTDCQAGRLPKFRQNGVLCR